MAEPSEDGSPSEADSTAEDVPGTEGQTAGTTPQTSEDATEGESDPDPPSPNGDQQGQAEGTLAGETGDQSTGDSDPETAESGSRDAGAMGTDPPTGTVEDGTRAPEAKRTGDDRADPTPPEEDESMRRAMDREDGEPGVNDNVSSLAGRAKPALAERQALVAVAGSVGIGVIMAVVGVALDLTVRDVKVVLALGGLFGLLIGVFVLFRAMLSAAERNDEPVKSAVTHPLFMFLFVLLATGTALFIGLLRRAY